MLNYCNYKNFKYKGLKSIKLQDQIKMIKKNFFKVCLLRNVFITQNLDKRAVSEKKEIFLTFESGHCLSRLQIESIYDVCLVDPYTNLKKNVFYLFLIISKVQFTSAVIGFCEILFDLNLNDIEIGILSALLLTSTS